MNRRFPTGLMVFILAVAITFTLRRALDRDRARDAGQVINQPQEPIRKTTTTS
jgi:hypothetical protein